MIIFSSRIFLETKIFKVAYKQIIQYSYNGMENREKSVK